MRWLPGADEAANSPLPRPDDGNTDGLRADVSPEPPRPDPPLAWALPVCARTLRAAGEELGRLPVSVRIAGLSRVARSWLDPDDPLRCEAIERVSAETGLHPAMVAWGLDRAFEAVTVDALSAWWADEGGAGEVGLSGHIAAGNVFVAWLPPVIASVLSGTPALVKAPSACPSFPALFARSMAIHAPELGPCVGAAAWSRSDDRATSALLAAVDALFVFGDDATVAALEAEFDGPVHGFGHRYSIGFVTGGDLRGLAEDVLAWDGAGCLTPRWIFVEGDAQAVFEALTETLEEAASRLPPGAMDEATGAARASWIGVEGALADVRFGEGWAASVRPGPTLDPAPPGRCVAIVPAARGDLLDLLSSLGPRLQGVSLVGTPADAQELGSLLAPLGVSRVAPAGTLQRPPLAWNHDDVRLLPAFD